MYNENHYIHSCTFMTNNINHDSTHQNVSKNPDITNVMPINGFRLRRYRHETQGLFY